jgi:hypothetical protein
MLEIPKVTAPVRTEPRTILINGAVKIGKTTICAELSTIGNSIAISTDPDGYDAVEARYLRAETPGQFVKLLSELTIYVDKHGQFDFLILDNATRMDEFSEVVGTYNYMNSSMGKSYNNAKNPDGSPILVGTSIKKYTHLDKEWESALNLPNGAGYSWTRNAMVEWFEKISKLAKHTIFITHVKDVKIETKLGDLIDSTTIDLTGKVKNIFASKVDAVAQMLVEGSTRYLSFENKEGNIIAGCRYDYLANKKITISEKDKDGNLKIYWENIFPSLTNI